jgi:chemotaxis protein CheC
MTNLQSTVTDLDSLQQVLASATQDASEAMSVWTNGAITLSLDEVREVPLEAVQSEYDFGDDLLTMVVLTLHGELGGSMILMFDEGNGRKLAGALLGRTASTETTWSELEQSALCETGNILGCAYMNALTNLIGCELVPSPPYFLQDFGASVLEQSLLAQAADTDQILICRTTFCREGQTLDWNVFFVPTCQLRNLLTTAFDPE